MVKWFKILSVLNPRDDLLYEEDAVPGCKVAWDCTRALGQMMLREVSAGPSVYSNTGFRCMSNHEGPGFRIEMAMALKRDTA